MRLVRPIVLLTLLSVPFMAGAGGRFVEKVPLPSGQTAVVAEGDFEARSVGSYSVRLYDAAQPPDQTTFFAAGVVQARDGAIEKVLLADVAGDAQSEIVVVVRSAGTGGYLSAQAFSFGERQLTFVAEVKELAAGADVVEALKKGR